MRFFLSALLCFLSLASFAGPVEDYVTLFKDRGYDWEGSGNMCEYVAREEMKVHFPEDRYLIKSGITYKFKNQVIGELDLIVFNKATNLVDYIGEVKCWKEVKEGFSKAMQQRERFKKYVGRAVIIQDHEQTYTPEQFRAVQSYFSVGQRGSLSAGFNYELSLDLIQAKNLREAMLRCQSSGACKKN